MFANNFLARKLPPPQDAPAHSFFLFKIELNVKVLTEMVILLNTRRKLVNVLIAVVLKLHTAPLIVFVVVVWIFFLLINVL